MIKISVIIPVYNVEKYLEACLDSVLAQSLRDIEVLCIDDASTDGSPEILHRYAERDARVRLFANEENRGPAYSRNVGLKHATGAYVYFLDSDDLVPGDALQEIYEASSHGEMDAVMFDIENLLEDGWERNGVRKVNRYQRVAPGVYAGRDLYVLLCETEELVLLTCTCCWRRTFLMSHQLAFHAGFLHEDVAFSFCAMLLAQSVRVIPVYGYIYRRRADSISTRADSMKMLLGNLAAYLDESAFLVDHAKALGTDCVRCASKKLLCLAKMIERDISTMQEEEMPIEEPLAQFARDQFARNRYRYSKGYLTLATQAFLKRQLAIIVYGAGKIGHEVLCMLEKYGIRTYRLAVTKKGDDTTGLMGMAVELHTLQSLRETALVVISAGKTARPQMLAEAQRMGFRQIVGYDEIM